MKNPPLPACLSASIAWNRLACPSRMGQKRSALAELLFPSHQRPCWYFPQHGYSPCKSFRRHVRHLDKNAVGLRTGDGLRRGPVPTNPPPCPYSAHPATFAAAQSNP